ncbi:MAG TPA: gliding motility-associated C-terminal domain-containing protein, partial [Hymenobacter sp.]|nr:gliding motility-associated C-terminal domain-containing protein [Hymenobacter sp.]
MIAGVINADQTVCSGAIPASLSGTAASGGTGSYSYQWESSNNNTTWTAVAGATAATYAPGPVSATTYFRRQVSSGTGTCATTVSNVVTLTVLPTLTAGVIGANQTVCAGTAPAALTNTTNATGGTGSYTYQWELSLDNLTWGAIAGATGAIYAPGTVSVTTYFRRQVVSGTGTCATATSNVVTVSVLPAVAAGSIGTDQTVCAGAAPAPFTNQVPASGGTGNYTYQWESSVNTTTWAAVAGATGATYTPDPVSVTTYFRRQVTSGTGTCATSSSNVVALTVLPVLTAGTVGADQSVCPGATPIPLASTSAATGGTGTYTYQWESSADNLTWVAIAGATGAAYAPGPISATTYFRRQVTSGTGSCATARTTTVTISVLPGLTAGTISSDQTVCAGSALAALTGPAAGGGTGSYAYQWESSLDNLNWTAIAGATSTSYTPVSVSVTTYFRRQVTSGTGACATATSNVVVVNVRSDVAAGSIGSNQTLCAGAMPAAFTNEMAASGGTGSYIYQWESSVNTTTWTAIAGATGISYTPGPVSVTTYFRRQVTSGTGTCATSSSNVVVLTVAPVLTAGTINSDQTVCPGSAPAALAGTPADGGIGSYTYQWELSVNNTTWTPITGATGVSYTPAPASVTTYFRRQVTSGTGTCATAASNVVTLTVLPTLTAGSVSADQTVCAGTAPTALTGTLPTGGTGSYTYQWESSLDATTWTFIAGATSATYAPGPVTATVSFRRQVTSGTGACATTVSNSVSINVLPAVIAGRISTDQTLCANSTPAALTNDVPASGGNGTYAYQWESSVNNTNWNAVAGATSSSYTPGPVSVTTYFRRRVTSGTGTCATAASNVVTLTVTPAQTASVALATPPAQCTGSTLTFTPSPTNGGAAPTYRWFVNNVLMATSPTFTSSTLANNDQVRVEMTPTPGFCTTGTPTATVAVALTPVIAPTLSIRMAGASGPACEGALVSFNIDNITGAGTAPQYQWLLNGTAVAGSTGTTFSSATFREGDRLRLQLRSSEACANPAVVLSNEVILNIRPNVAPEVVITSSGITCIGQPVRFAIASSGNLGTAPGYQWKVNGADVAGAQSATFSSNTLRDRDIVTLAVRTVTACGQATSVVSNQVQAIITPPLQVNAGPDKEIMEGETVVLEGTANGTFPVEWLPAQTLSFAGGNPLRPVASPKTTTVYTLRTNVDGCSAEDKVTVKVGPPIRIPNAFSPNGDGTNDTWKIDRIDAFTGNSITIFNRWGNKVYSANGYGSANEWRGIINGEPAPIGTYYYVIKLGDGRTYTGPL